MRVLVLAAVVAFATLALSSAAASSGADAAQKVTVRASAYGRILFDGRGFALYGFTKDTARRSRCSGACAKAWPPYLVSGKPVAGRGVKPSLLGTIQRPNGRRQVTYAGKPLYYYVGDRKRLQVLCQNVREFGGLWLVVRPKGTFVR
jgi:predicted lipoprotein with Yx(FWY)xxD motif